MPRMSINTKYKELVFCSLFFISFIFGQNAPPSLFADDSQAFCPGNSIVIAPGFTISDPDDTGVVSFSAQISSGYEVNLDKLDLDTSLYPSIGSASWSLSEGKLTLTGVGGAEMLYTELQDAVRAIVFTTTVATVENEKVFSLTIGDANYLLSTNNFYEFVSDVGITWNAAKAAAAVRTYYGRPGYLATFTSQEEADFAGKQASGAGWIGGSDAAVEGTWKWVTGPEAGTTFWNGGVGGSSPNFAFWNSGEPNNQGNEHYAHIKASGVSGEAGSWNDLSNAGNSSGDYQPKGYIVEYGTPSDPPLSIVATTSIYIPKILSVVDAAICEGETAIVSATSTFGAIDWFATSDSTTVLNTGATYTVSGLTATTTYYVAAQEDTCIPRDRTLVNVTVTTNLQIIKLMGAAVCSGEAAVFAIEGTPNAMVTYTIDTGADTTVVLDVLGEAEVTVAGITTAATITLSKIDLNGCSTNLTDTHTVAVNPNPIVNTVTTNSIICSGATAIFTINGTPEATVTYKINGGSVQAKNLDTAGDGSLSIPDVTADTTIELLEIKEPLNGCSTDVIGFVAVVTVFPEPSVIFPLGNDILSCSGSEILRAEASVGGASAGEIYWYDAAIGGIEIGIGNEYTTNNPTPSGIKTYYAEVRFNGCVFSPRSEVKVSFNSTIPDFDVVQNSYTLCSDIGSVTLETKNPQDITNYVWYRDSVLLPLENSKNLTVTESGNYTVLAISAYGCESAEKSIVVIDSEIASISREGILIIEDSDDPINNSIQILSSSLGIGDYEFSLDDEFGTYKDEGGGTVVFDGILPGIHLLYIRDKWGCGTIVYQFSVLEFPNFFTPNDDATNELWKINGFKKVVHVSVYNRFGVLLYQERNKTIANYEGWNGIYQGKKSPSNSYWYRAIFMDANGLEIEKVGFFSLLRK